MAKPSDEQQRALAGLLGLGSHSARKSHYPELAARLDELEAERNRYKWLFENAVHGIFQASLLEGMRAANPALARMLGYQNPQEVLFSLADLASNLFVGGARELENIGEILRHQGSLNGYETQLRRKDGSRLDVLMNLLLKPDQEELVEGFVADITERKLAQQRLQQLNDQLEQRVTARTDELLEANRNLQQQITQRKQIAEALRDARDAAEAANRSKDKYLAAASHDLLQPLNAARLLISTLRERRLPEVEQVLVERTHQALEGAEDLLTDLLDISRLDQAAVKPDIALYRLDELLGPLVSEFRSVAEAAGLNLRVHMGDYAINTDLRLMTRILRNFLSNACRYTDAGSILLGPGGAVRCCAWKSGTPDAGLPLTGWIRSSSSSTSWTSAVPPIARVSAWGWRLSSASRKFSTTGSRCIRGRGVDRCSASTCRFPMRSRCRSVKPRPSRVRATRCQGGDCWCWTTKSASLKA